MGNTATQVQEIKQMLGELAAQWSAPPLVHFKRHGIPPQSSQYIGPDDWLQVQINTTALTTGLILGMRYLTADGLVHYLSQSLDGVAINTPTTKIVRLAEGWMLGVSATNWGTALADKACFVLLGLQQNSGTGIAPHTVLAQGYVSGLFAVCWPESLVRGGP